MKEMLPGDSELFKASYMPSDLVDLANLDSELATLTIGGRPIIRNAETRQDYMKRAFALRLAAYVLWAYRLGYLEFKE